MATYDPVTTAKALAESYVHARQAQVDTNTKKTQSKTTALTSLQSALSGFSTALSSLSGKGSVIAQTAAVSRSSAAAATVSSAAAPGNYTFGVSKLATAQQTLYSMQDLGLAPGTDYPKDATMVVSAVGGAGYVQVDLDKADENGDGKLSVTEIARALNQASAGKITASMVTQGGEQKLMLTSTETGEANAFELKMQKQDGSAVALVAGQKLSEAQDAVFTLGAGTGVEIRQASNTYTGIEGLTLEFKEVTTSPFTVTVAKDEAATKANMQGFIDAYNGLVKAIDKLTAAGSAEGGVAAAALNGDSGVRGLRNQLNSLLRSTVNGVSLTDFGISAQRDGTIALDAGRFAKKVASNPDALTSLLGKTDTLEYKRTGVLGSLQTYVGSWTNSSTGYLKTRQDGLQKQLTQYTKDQSTIERLYAQAYQRYLTQFTTLANLEATMSNTSNYLSSMFAPSSKS